MESIVIDSSGWHVVYIRDAWFDENEQPRVDFGVERVVGWTYHEENWIPLTREDINLPYLRLARSRDDERHEFLFLLEPGDEFDPDHPDHIGHAMFRAKMRGLLQPEDDETYDRLIEKVGT